MRGFGVEELIACYRRGVFPMAESREDPRIFLLNPDERGIIPLDRFHVPRSLRKTVRRDVFHVTVNRCFEAVVKACAAPGPNREETWINAPILRLYLDMHRAGYAHSLECWKEGRLAGGLYGVSLGGAFFGESMFSRATDASKVALVHLVARLKAGGYRLLDAQFTTAHLERFGAEAIGRDAYLDRLDRAVETDADFFALPEGLSGDQLLQSITQTS
ncbi:leucyl/phenylalanyl-tRNA--protein transferase [Marinicauda algicola]|uniref:Leucyl/phenylalanyl-tRNA--protein transferase n=1 Tax=Marinicauda algicola TaxID=2029849 RepID=A0A4S2H2L9_9PROT|nr:leucyl/phenylalanyl-tRNA--protein transferase [Marinicauda algicola]TGY89837.1 leucyl/phenylalanyl-tRNA--protein transferase [Marinicauda algicola]